MHFFLEVPIFELYNIHMTGLSVQLGVLGTILRQFGRLNILAISVRAMQYVLDMTVNSKKPDDLVHKLPYKY